MRLLAVILAAVLVLIPPFQTAAQEQVPQAPPKVSVALREGDKVRVKTLVALSSATANVGDVFDGEVVEDIDVNGKVVIAKGASALGTITAVQRAGWLGGGAGRRRESLGRRGSSTAGSRRSPVTSQLIMYTLID